MILATNNHSDHYKPAKKDNFEPKTPKNEP